MDFWCLHFHALSTQKTKVLHSTVYILGKKIFHLNVHSEAFIIKTFIFYVSFLDYIISDLTVETHSNERLSMLAKLALNCLEVSFFFSLSF